MLKGSKHTKKWKWSIEAKTKLSLKCIGRPSGMKGKHLSEETKKILSLKAIGRPSAFKGKKHTEKALEKIRLTQFKKGHFVPCGEKSPGWRGGVAVNNKCIECNKKIWWGAKRCQKHNIIFYGKQRKETGKFKGNKNPNYKGGLPKCIDCKKELTDRKHKRCKSCFIKYYKGERTFLWKGGITTLSERIRSIKEYENWRKQIFKKNNYTCQECFHRGGNLEAHHIKSFSLLFQEFLQQYSQFSPLEDKETLIRLSLTYEPFWDVNNGETLCIRCHDLLNKRGVKNVL